jgi:dihydroneopterin aldolase
VRLIVDVEIEGCLSAVNVTAHRSNQLRDTYNYPTVFALIERAFAAVQHHVLCDFVRSASERDERTSFEL